MAEFAGEPNGAGRRFAVVANNAFILRLLEITKLADVLEVYPTLESARAAMRRY